MDKMKLWDMIVEYGEERYWTGQWEDNDWQEPFLRHSADADALLEKIRDFIQAAE